MKFCLITAAVIGLVTASTVDKAKDGVPEIFLIRHVEKNPDGTISDEGKQREKCLINVFGKNSSYNIQHIMVQTPYPGGMTEILYPTLPRRF